MVFKRWWLAGLAMGVIATAPADAAWRRAVTDHFVIYSEDSPEDLKAYAEKLERFDSAVRVARGMGESAITPAAKLKVFAVRDVDLLQKIFGVRGSVAGFYLPRHEGSVAFVARDTTGYRIPPEVVFFHEYSHHLMLQRSNDALPAWLVEGFAEFYSTAQFEPDGSVGFGKSATHRADTFRYLSPVPLRVLLTKMDWSDQAMVQSLYARGWLLTHYLAFSKERAGQLSKYIENFRSGMSDLESAKNAFGDLDKLDDELNLYLRKARLPYATVAADKIKTGPIAIAELTAAEQEVMPVYMLSKRGVTSKTAPAVAADARAVANRFPNDPMVLAELAEAEFDAGNTTASLAAADRVIAADPKRVKGWIYKARSILANAKNGDDITAARKAIAAANRIDPDDPEPLVLFYDTYGKQGAKPTANATEGLLFAQHEVPQDISLRWRVVRMLMREGRSKDAADMLVPIAFAPHGGGDRSKLVNLLALLRSGDLAGANALIAGDKALSAAGGESPDADKK